MKKLSTTYQLTEYVLVTVNEELKETIEHISLHSYGEPCFGILKHWGSKAEIISELETIIKKLKELKV